MKESQFDSDAYMRRLDRAYAAGTPWLAVVPDLIAAGLKSLDFSMKWKHKLPSKWPLYLAIQDGMRTEDLDGIDGFSGIFMGGSTRFKSEGPSWCNWSHANGMRFHYARCSSPSRLVWARNYGADSIDSSQPLWSWDALSAFERAYVGPQQKELF